MIRVNGLTGKSHVQEAALNNTKFTMNAMLVIVIVFSAIGLFFTVGIYDMGQHVYLVTERKEIKGTDLSIRYSTKEPSGLYRGTKNEDELMIEGNFGGNDSGIAVCGDQLYLNEYTFTDTGMMLSEVVMVDMNSFDEYSILENAELRGRCVSGELVCVGDCLPGTAASASDANSLRKLYCMTSGKLNPDTDTSTVFYVDPDSGEPVYSASCNNGMSEKEFNALWLSRTLEEVRQ